MELFKKSERVLKSSMMIKTFKQTGGKVKNLGEFRKWKEISDGSRLSVSMTFYKLTANGKDAYFLSDSLGRVACPFVADAGEIKKWLKDHGYKTEHDFYIEDYGMTEETWKVWNSEE